MMILRIGWVVEQNNKNICLVPRTIVERFKLSPEKKYYLHLGQQIKEVVIRPSGINNQFLYIEPTTFLPDLTVEEITVYENVELNFWVKDEEIFLGPVVGIFVRPNQLKVPDAFSSFMSHMTAGQEKHFLCYYFSCNSIDWEGQRVRGFTFVPDMNKWIYAWLPLPDVVYDRGAGFAMKHKKSVKEIRRKLRVDTLVRFINTRGYIGKWKLYQKLSKHNEIAQYLPQTVSYEGLATLGPMVQKFDLLFLKSYFGSHGKEVLSIEKLQAEYKLTFYEKGLKELVVRDLIQLEAYIECFIRKKKFILQQGIRLLTYKNRLFDMRVLMIKNKDGKWMVMSNYARIAKVGFTITNYSAGGECDFYNNLYPDLCNFYGKLVIPDYDQIAAVALQIAAVVEREFGQFGELGLDLAVDSNGRLWLIEVNAKPNKDLVEELDDFTTVGAQYLAIFAYAGYLCGMND
ncbi:MAG: YheC/YheD family protein [Firmicutes bacterium]|nr:YheC/YheD family protein [Bacillota bacterium]